MKVVAIIRAQETREFTPEEVRQLVNLAALARVGGALPVIPQLDDQLAKLLLKRTTGRRGPPSANVKAILEALDGRIDEVWCILTDAAAEIPLPTMATMIARPWSVWHDDLAAMNLGGLDEFEPQRPLLDRWLGDEDLPSYDVDPETKRVSLAWPLLGVNGSFQAPGSNPDLAGDVLPSVIASFMRATWQRMRETMSELDDLDPKFIGRIVSVAVTAGRPPKDFEIAFIEEEP